MRAEISSTLAHQQHYRPTFYLTVDAVRLILWVVCLPVHASLCVMLVYRVLRLNA